MAINKFPIPTRIVNLNALDQSVADAATSAAASEAARDAAAASATAADADATATSADRVQTGLDRVATGADVVAAAASETAAAASAVQAATYDPTFRYATAQLLLDSTRAAGGAGTIWQGEGFLYREAEPDATDQHVTTAVGVKLYVLPGADGRASVLAFGVVNDIAADSTAAAQKAIDSHIPLTWPEGQFLITDSLRISIANGCDIEAQHKTVSNLEGFSRILFDPPTKRDLFVWDTPPAGYVFAGVKITGLSVRGGSTAGGRAVFNLVGLYKGNLEAFVWVNFDHYAIVEGWLHCELRGNINGWRVSGVKIENPTLAGNRLTTRTIFDIYMSGGATGLPTVGYDIGTWSIIGGRIFNMIESTDCAIRMAIGNTIDSAIYTENIPQTNAGALFEIGKTGAGAPDGTTLFAHRGVNLHGRNVPLEADRSATVFADIGRCDVFSISDCDVKRFGSLLKTTVDSKNISFSNIYAIGIPLLQQDFAINNIAQVAFSAFRAVEMFAAGALFSSDPIPTVDARNPIGTTRPRWYNDMIYCSDSRSYWTSTGIGLFDWRLSGAQIYEGSSVVDIPSIVAGGSYQFNITVFGALAGDLCQVTAALSSGFLTINSRVSAADTVRVTVTNVSGTAVDDPAVTFRAAVTKRFTT